MSTDSTRPSGFDQLAAKYPWPDRPPVPEAPLVGRDSSGFELLRSVLGRLGKPNPVIMEVGAEFGGSTRKFLDFDGAYVVSVDPWPDSYGGGSFPELRPYLGGDAGMYNLFLTFNFEFRHRLIAVREWSPAGPVAVHDAGLEVDLIYIDGDHRYDPVLRDLTVARTLFPDAVITGDDWLLTSDHRKYEGIALPVQTAVRRWAAVNDVYVEVEGNSWVLDPSRKFNLDRPVPHFNGKRLDRPAAKQCEHRPESELVKVESTLTDLAKSLRAIEASLANLPSRRVARRARRLVHRSR